MSRLADVCPQCGRALPEGHALCVKCGWRRDTLPDSPADRDRTSRQVWLVAGLGAGLLVGLLALVLLLWPESNKPEGTDRSTRSMAVAAREDPDRPLAPRRRATPRSRLPRSRAPVAPTPTPTPTPPPPPPLAPRRTSRADSLIDRVRACVDKERREAERDCESTRRWLGHTAESICLVAKVGAAYYTCLKGEAKNLGSCVVRCGGVARRCASGCATGDPAQKTGGTAGCLWQCWRRDIDPCIGRCIRP